MRLTKKAFIALSFLILNPIDRHKDTKTQSFTKLSASWHPCVLVAWRSLAAPDSYRDGMTNRGRKQSLLNRIQKVPVCDATGDD